jgi:hypothetical protein
MVRSDTTKTARLIRLALSTALVACQGSDLTLPADGLPSSLEEVSGSGQEGRIGTVLPKPLIVRVTDGAARPLSQVSVRFETDVPGAEVPLEVFTNDTGYAIVRVRLGETEGPQTFDALVADASELRTTFAVTAIDPQPHDDGNGGGGRGGERDDDDDHGNGHGHGGHDDNHDDDEEDD